MGREGEDAEVLGQGADWRPVQEAGREGAGERLGGLWTGLCAGSWAGATSCRGGDSRKAEGRDWMRFSGWVTTGAGDWLVGDWVATGDVAGALC